MIDAIKGITESCFDWEERFDQLKTEHKLTTHQRDLLRELNYAHENLKAKHDILQTAFDDLLDDNDLSELEDNDD